jgi:hypothetical protein
MAAMKKPGRPEMPPQGNREPPRYVGDIAKTCANCQHFEPDNRPRPSGPCHNGISGKLTTRDIDGCAFGFYPSVERFPLKAGPGGVR